MQRRVPQPLHIKTESVFTHHTMGSREEAKRTRAKTQEGEEIDVGLCD